VTGEETSGLAGLGMRGSGVGGGGSGYGAGVGYGAGAARTPSPEPVVVPEPEPPAEPMPDAAVVDLDEWEDEDGDGAYYSYDGGYYEDELDLAYDEPADVHHTSAEVQMSRSRPAIRFPSLGGGGAKKKKDKKAKKPPPAPPPRASGRDEPRRAGGRDADKRGESTRESDRTSIQIMSDSTEDGEVEVTAAALSVVIPSAGQAVRYQQLLLPADAAHTVLVSAKRPRRSEHR